MESQNLDVQNNSREKFNRSPTAKLSGDEIFQMAEPLDMNAIRAKVIPWMKEHGYFSCNYKNNDTGWDNIMITPNGVKSGLQHFSGPEKIQAFAALPKMIENGILIKTNPGKSNQTGMKEHIFAAKVDIGQKNMGIGLVIKEDSNGIRYYDHELTEIKNLDGLSPHAGSNGQNAPNADQTRQGSVIKIIKKALDVNSKD
jgi:hypothetical protein